MDGASPIHLIVRKDKHMVGCTHGARVCAALEPHHGDEFQPTRLKVNSKPQPAVTSEGHFLETFDNYSCRAKSESLRIKVLKLAKNGTRPKTARIS